MMLCCTCHDFRTEFSPCQPWFQVKEPLTDRYLDIPQSFGAHGSALILVGKVLTTGVVVATLVLSMLESDHLDFFFAYFTSWSLAFSCLYTLTSLSNTLIPLQQPQSAEEHEAHNDADVEIIVVAQSRVKWTWIIFDLSIVTQLTTVLVYWTLVYESGDSLDYLDILAHGPVFACVLIDGLYLNRIPLRWMHLWMIWTFVILYFVWTVIHGPLVLDLGNPNEESDDPNQNDDAIYSNLSWQSDDIVDSVILSCIVAFVVVPLEFWLLRLWSVGTSLPFFGDRRRYYTNDGEDGYALTEEKSKALEEEDKDKVKVTVVPKDEDTDRIENQDVELSQTGTGYICCA
eukprot:CAMPEP_0172447096 /NCGR_PEP_ID=MMETSP1065-20121228/6469_1 /TAXON_ID=265537 /ORGANISM="Amphiprora paludosa, Strain CCMP125" /LENGTH=343 /DNA_ID=CAMNT_0013198311 /DNA_START=132 /DNA_END=1163 /DNA_ORIENTATION=-